MFLSSASPVNKKAKVVDDTVHKIIEADMEKACDMCVFLFNKMIQSSVPQRSSYIGLVYVAKMRPALFERKELFSVLLTTLKTETGNQLYPLLACNLLLKGFNDRKEWPLDFCQVFLYDSFGKREWVDHELAAPFIQGILTAFEDVKEESRYKDEQARAKLKTVAVALARKDIERTENVRYEMSEREREREERREKREYVSENERVRIRE